MLGPEILVRSMSAQRIGDRFGNVWQYHPRSDSHSKITCWAVLFDLLRNCALLRRHAADGKIGFGINHKMTDFVSGQLKALDLVITIPRATVSERVTTFRELADAYRLVLTPGERSELEALPEVRRRPVGDVLMAMETKAAMTAHSKAGPRFFDELTSAWRCINGSAPHAIAVGVALVNAATEFVSPERNQFPLTTQQADLAAAQQPNVSRHKQPGDAELSQNRVRQVNVREHTNDHGYDAKGIVTILARNDLSPITLAPIPPSLDSSDPLNYERMILRIAGIYDGRFAAR